MCFEKLHGSNEKNELILIDGGMCRWHLRKDGQITIYEILSNRPSAGSEMLEQLKSKGGSSLFAKCPADLDANKWYKKRGFELEGTEILASGRSVNSWRLPL